MEAVIRVLLKILYDSLISSGGSLILTTVTFIWTKVKAERGRVSRRTKNRRKAQISKETKLWISIGVVVAVIIFIIIQIFGAFLKKYYIHILIGLGVIFIGLPVLAILLMLAFVGLISIPWKKIFSRKRKKSSNKIVVTTVARGGKAKKYRITDEERKQIEEIRRKKASEQN